jgi:hypothetical protein
MAIIGTLLGMGVGVFSNLGRADRQAAGQIKDALRAARLFALQSSAPAAVVVDPPHGEIFGLGLAPVGNWHFEDDAGTGWPVAARHAADALLADGVLGSALGIAGEDALMITELPGRFDSPHGFGVDVFLRPDREPRPMTLLERPGSWSLRLDEESQLEVRLVLQSKPNPEEFRLTLPVSLPAERYTQVTVVFDGRVLHVALDGRRVGEDTLFATPRLLQTAPGAPLRTGREEERYRGAIDELAVSSVIEGDHRPLPADVALEGALRVLRFDAQGHLDPDWHRTPERITFRHGSPEQRTFIELGQLGTVRSWTESP